MLSFVLVFLDKFYFTAVKQVLHHPVGVIGAGRFGTAIALLLARKTEVLLYARRAEVYEEIEGRRQLHGQNLPTALQAVASLEEVARRCRLIFPVVPSENFRSMMQVLGPYLSPAHFLIHGTKGFDVYPRELLEKEALHPSQVRTMSKIILEESPVLRVGCLSGPNLAVEIMEGQPTATVIGSHYKEVIALGQYALSGPRFQVFGTHDMLGAELAGALKNIIAIASGMLAGMGLGKNIQALLITRGLMEMIHFGKEMGATPAAFLGTAGIGDLICTATSEKSRNFSFGYRLARGEASVSDRMAYGELVEGVRTLLIVHKISRHRKLSLPLVSILYKILYEDLSVERGLELLMRFPYNVDVDFWEDDVQKTEDLQD